MKRYGGSPRVKGSDKPRIAKYLGRSFGFPLVSRPQSYRRGTNDHAALKLDGQYYAQLYSIAVETSIGTSDEALSCDVLWEQRVPKFAHQATQTY